MRRIGLQLVREKQQAGEAASSPGREGIPWGDGTREGKGQGPAQSTHQSKHGQRHPS